MFIYFNNQVMNAGNINWIECTNLIECNYITIYFFEGASENVRGQEAFDIVNKLCPEMLEGKRAKYAKNAWTLHNLVGHPMMQVCSWFGFKKLSMWFHDSTIPAPMERK